MEGLERVSEIFDFSVYFTNDEAAELGVGHQFGDVALNTSESRATASVVIKEENSFFAYLEREDYQNVLSQAYAIDVQRRFKILSCNNFFEHLSNNRFRRIQYHLKRVKVQKNQIIYQEGDDAVGFYLIL